MRCGGGLTWRRPDKDGVRGLLVEPIPARPEITGTGLTVGSTIREVIDALGQPDKTDERVLKTTTAHVLKYGPRARHFAPNVKIENGRVVGWEGEIRRRPAQDNIEKINE